LFTLGCPRSQAATARLFPYLERNGWRLTRRIDRAGLVLVAGCAFNNDAEEQSVAYLHCIRSEMTDEARLVVVGCLAGISPERLADEFGCESVSPCDMERLDALLDSRVPLADIEPVNNYDDILAAAQPPNPDPARRRPLYQRLATGSLRRWRIWQQRRLGMPDKRRIFHITVAQGCLSECSYCAIRFACGSLTSRKAESIVEEFQRGRSMGYRHFDLIAGDLAAYGQDIDTDLPALLESLLAADGDCRIDLLDANPAWLVSYRERLLKVLRRHPGRLGRFVIPIQSGSDRVLERMKRGYGIDEALDLTRELMAADPHCAIDTHVLVGFPGETERDFEQTLEAIEAVGYHRVMPYAYADRSGTEAAAMSDKVAPAIIAERKAHIESHFQTRPI
jgi:tRNA A37 methylthiotransferase MiaB